MLVVTKPFLHHLNCQTLGDKYPDIKDRAVPHLTSRDKNECWTSGQWMTERRGGSDVGM